MATNLIELFDQTIGSLLVKQAGSILGETADHVSSALKLAVPALVSGLIQKGGTDTGAAQLLTYMKENQIDGSVLANADHWLQGNIETEKLMYSGAVISRHLFEDKLGPVVDLMASSCGLKTSSATSVLKLAAPFLLGILARITDEKSLDASGIKSTLLAQKPVVKDALPNEMKALLVWDKTPDAKSSSSKTGSGEPGRSKLLPWIVLAITALGLFYLVKKGCMGKAEPDVEETTTVVAPDTIKQEVATPADPMRTFTLPDGKAFRAMPGTFSAELASFLTAASSGQRCLVFDKVQFESNSFKLTKSSEKQLAELSILLKAYPEAKAQIEGHTDNEGDPGKNKNLSRERAKVLKTWLIENGVNGAQVDIKGWGEEKPVASNDTPSGRAKNRRMECCVTKK